MINEKYEIVYVKENDTTERFMIISKNKYFAIATQYEKCKIDEIDFEKDNSLQYIKFNDKIKSLADIMTNGSAYYITNKDVMDISIKELDTLCNIFYNTLTVLINNAFDKKYCEALPINILCMYSDILNVVYKNLNDMYDMLYNIITEDKGHLYESFIMLKYALEPRQITLLIMIHEQLSMKFGNTADADNIISLLK